MRHRSSFMASLSCLSQILLILTIECSFGVVFNSTPQDLDGLVDNSSVIVAGSVIQLFCSASGQFTATHIQWTRNNITIPETAQLPHLMVKSRTENNTITSSTLIIGGFSATDNGNYTCLAQETGGSTVISGQLLLTVAVASRVIKVIRELNSAPGNISNASGLYSDDRTYVALGSPSGGAGGSFLRCSAEQPWSLLAAAPSVTWLKDGAQLVGDGVRVTINTSSSIVATSNRTASYVRIFNFRQSDAGVYQCVFYDTPSQGGEVITTRPYKVDTGPIRLTTSFPSTICLCPPWPLVIQVEASGEYIGIQWIRTPRSLNITSDQLVDFDQTFVMSSTSMNDGGIYLINLVPSNSTSTSASINFNVTLDTANPASTKVASNMVVTKPGMSVDIVCTSSGYPMPTVTWYYQPDNQPSTYGSLPPSVTVGQPIQVCNGACVSCRVSSRLRIDNVSSYIHKGVYLCVGFNIINGKTVWSNASVNLVVMSGNDSSTMVPLPSQATSTDFLLNITVIVSVISAVIIVTLAIGLIVVVARKKNCGSKQSLSNAAGTEMMPVEIDVVPKPQDIPAYSRLFQDTPFYQPHRGRSAFNTQSVPALAVLDHKELRESKSSSSSFLNAPPPCGYEKPVSSSESIGNRTRDQAAVFRIPSVPEYTDKGQDEEDFVTVDELVEMNQKKHHHRYEYQGTSPSARQLLSSSYPES